MADHSDHMGASAPNWEFYQFMYRSEEVVVAISPYRVHHAMRITSSGGLAPVRYTLKISAYRSATRPFDMDVNGKTKIKMQPYNSRGWSYGHRDHWAGPWTNISGIDVHMYLNGITEGDIIPPPFAKPVPKPWEVQSSFTPPSPSHPSGLCDEDLEDCQYCGQDPMGCYECLNTGRIPKQQPKKEYIMNTRELITAMQLQNGAKVVSVSFNAAIPQAKAPGSAEIFYHFKNAIGVQLRVGDVVVVQGAPYSLATVVNPDVRANELSVNLGELKHIVSRVDTTAIGIVQEAENNALHALALSEVAERVDTMRKQIGDNAFNQMNAMLGAPKLAEQKD